MVYVRFKPSSSIHMLHANSTNIANFPELLKCSTLNIYRVVHVMRNPNFHNADEEGN